MDVRSERRLVSCLFTDVVGSTDATVQLGPGIRDMHQVRAGHTATLLRDGSVLVAGGNAELYEPGT
jgi:phosphoribosylformimino-5-aminoimidazole carboxamide ribonucleotide (ProFAR) isomerase